MTYSPSTTIKGPSAGSVGIFYTMAQKQGALRLADLKEYLETIYRVAPQVGLRAEVIVVDSILETGWWTSSWWNTRLNPAGIGITGDAKQNDASKTWTSGESAALAHLTHMWLYAVGTSLPTGLLKTDDPRWDVAVAAGRAGIAPTLAGLSNTWAADADYATKIADRLNQIAVNFDVVVTTPDTGGTPVATITFGNVPKPAILDRVIPDADNWAWNNLGPLDVLGVVYHRQEGTNWGTDGWFRTLWQPNGQPAGGQLGLTSFGLSSTGATPIMMWNEFTGRARSGVSANRSPWASGPWESPPGGDGHAFVAKYGINAINQKLVAIEIDEFYTDPINDAGMNDIVALSAWIADQHHVPYTDYPLNPATDLVFTYTHNEFQNNKPCAGETVIADIPTIISKTRDLLEHYQTVTVKPPVVTPPKTPTYVKPNVPAFLKLWPWVQEVPFNDVVMKLATDDYKDPSGGIKVLAGGMTGAKETRAPFARDEVFHIVYEWEKAGIHWGLDPVGNRIDLTKAVRIGEWKPEQIAAPAKTT